MTRDGDDPAPRPKRPRHARRDDGGPDDGPVLPDVTRDETEAGWGEESARRDDDWYRQERPPHHE